MVTIRWAEVRMAEFLPCCNEYTKTINGLVTITFHYCFTFYIYSSKTEGESLVQKADWLRENLSGDKSLKVHTGTHLLYWM